MNCLVPIHFLFTNLLLLIILPDYTKQIEFANDVPFALDSITLLSSDGVSESLEILITIYKEAIKTERGLDQLLDDYNFADREALFIKRIKDRTSKYEALAYKARVLHLKCKRGKLSKSQLKEDLVEVEVERVELDKDFSDYLMQNASTYMEIASFEEEKEKVQQKVARYPRMKDEFTKHTVIFRSKTNIETNSMEVNSFSGDNIDFDISIMETLLEKFQYLEQRKRDLRKMEKLYADYKEKEKVREEILNLEFQIIPRIVANNVTMISHFMPATVATTVRGIHKSMMLDALYTKVLDQVEKSNRVMRESLVEIAEYVEIVDQAVSYWFAMKDEL